jgi:hypothetical protein
MLRRAYKQALVVGSCELFSAVVRISGCCLLGSQVPAIFARRLKPGFAGDGIGCLIFRLQSLYTSECLLTVEQTKKVLSELLSSSMGPVHCS